MTSKCHWRDHCNLDLMEWVYDCEIDAYTLMCIHCGEDWTIPEPRQKVIFDLEDEEGEH